MRSRLARVVLVSVVAAACGRESTSPSLFGPDTGEERDGRVGGTLVAYGTGAPIANATVLLAGNVAITDARGEFTFANAPSSGTAVISASPIGHLRRAFSINLLPSRAGLIVDAIADAPPFDLEFYRQFARNSFEGSIQSLRRWTVAPKFYFNTTTVGSGLRVPDEIITRIVEIFRRSVVELSGGRLAAEVFDRGEVARTAEDGWVLVTFYQTLPFGGLGSASVGGNQGDMSIRYDPNLASNATTNPFNCESIPVAIADHEITHTMGYWHTANVFTDTFSGTGCPGFGRAPHVLYHAALVYAREPGNRDPDSDPETIHRATAPDVRNRPVVSCFRGPW
jgi:hypothetical protein